MAHRSAVYGANTFPEHYKSFQVGFGMVFGDEVLSAEEGVACARRADAATQ